MVIVRIPKKIYKPKILAKNFPTTELSYSTDESGRVSILVSRSDPDYNFFVNTDIEELERILEGAKKAMTEYDT